MLGLSVCSPGDSAGLDSYMYYVCLLVCPNETTTGAGFVHVPMIPVVCCIREQCLWQVFVQSVTGQPRRVLSKLDIRFVIYLNYISLNNFDIPFY